MSAVRAIGERTNNADLIADCHALGYLNDDDYTLDPTYGLGRFWTKWKPTWLVGSDLDPAKSMSGESVDFTDLPIDDKTFDAVVFDPPYKLNGTSTGKGPAASDEGYGVGGSYTTVADRHQLMLDGINEAVRVLKVGGRLLVKCQDQVCSGRVQWQTDMVTAYAIECGCVKVDALHVQSYRAQPEGRRQLHARRDYSTLLIFRKVSW
jgi:hypothetical protein